MCRGAVASAGLNTATLLAGFTTIKCHFWGREARISTYNTYLHYQHTHMHSTVQEIIVRPYWGPWCRRLRDPHLRKMSILTKKCLSRHHVAGIYGNNTILWYTHTDMRHSIQFFIVGHVSGGLGVVGTEHRDVAGWIYHYKMPLLTSRSQNFDL